MYGLTRVSKLALLFDRIKVIKLICKNLWLDIQIGMYSILSFRILIGSKLKYKVKYEDWRLVCLKNDELDKLMVYIS